MFIRKSYWENMFIKIVDDWIRTRFLWCRHQPLCQLCTPIWPFLEIQNLIARVDFNSQYYHHSTYLKRLVSWSIVYYVIELLSWKDVHIYKPLLLSVAKRVSLFMLRWSPFLLVACWWSCKRFNFSCLRSATSLDRCSNFSLRFKSSKYSSCKDFVAHINSLGHSSRETLKLSRSGKWLWLSW